MKSYYATTWNGKHYVLDLTFESPKEHTDYKNAAYSIKTHMSEMLARHHGTEEVSETQKSNDNRVWLEEVDTFASLYGNSLVPADIRWASNDSRRFWGLPEVDYGPDSGVEMTDKELKERLGGRVGVYVFTNTAAAYP